MRNKIEKCLSREIAIEYKACLYFSCLMAFDCAYLLYRKVYSVQILQMWEMILTAYFIGYLQVYVLRNFDESEQFGKWEIFASLLCTGIYTAASLVFEWFDRNLPASILFFGFVLLCYVCVYLCNKIKREIDTKHLNHLLEDYKKAGM